MRLDCYIYDLGWNITIIFTQPILSCIPLSVYWNSAFNVPGPRKYTPHQEHFNFRRVTIIYGIFLRHPFYTGEWN
ncbi:unnamed protein product [Allacma fusca]|uniref:Uncharacterized protein n=1 Tax=Allacma fusca TaxID=39272 RepID=A0A8J2PLN6_9HEXA|nr:unnamed protein product [Allacma fusca]